MLFSIGQKLHIQSPSRALPTLRIGGSLLFVVILLVSAGCGGGGGGGESENPGAADTTQLSGKAAFERITPLASGGLDYNNMSETPIRGARVDARDPITDAVWSSTTTDDTGSFSLTVPQEKAVRIVVLAQLEVASGTVAVRQGAGNATDGPTWGIYKDVDVGQVPIANQSLLAKSGWDVSSQSYISARSAAPFAIHDVLYRARHLIKEADSSRDAPLLQVFWSPDYSSSTIGTSHYSPSQNILRILGAADEDTDEFDHNVVAHEWTHGFMARSSRDDSLGGSHTTGDHLDETVAFSEGMANAMSGMIMTNTHYRDTMGVSQANTTINFDLRVDAPSGTNPGPWDEFRLTTLLFDLFDNSSDNNGVGLGFLPILETVTGPFATDPVFTTIYSFLYRLKEAHPAQATAIANRAVLAGIALGHDLYEGDDYSPLSGRYTPVVANGTAITNDIDGDPCQTWDYHGEISLADSGNKLHNRLYFKTNLPSGGTWLIRATPLDNNGYIAAGDLKLWVAGHGTADASYQTAETITITIPHAMTVCFAVGAFAGSQRFAVQVGTSDQITKPEAPYGDG